MCDLTHFYPRNAARTRRCTCIHVYSSPQDSDRRRLEGDQARQGYLGVHVSSKKEQVLLVSTQRYYLYHRKFKTLLPPLSTSPGKKTTKNCTGIPFHNVLKNKVPCMSFSAINVSGPAYLSELLHVYTPSRRPRSSSDTRMLKTQQYKRKTHGFRIFSCYRRLIWKISLPLHCSTLSSFKGKLKTSLFSQYFRPKLTSLQLISIPSFCYSV